jgi:hypothetical protein
MFLAETFSHMHEAIPSFQGRGHNSIFIHEICALALILLLLFIFLEETSDWFTQQWCPTTVILNNLSISTYITLPRYN